MSSMALPALADETPVKEETQVEETQENKTEEKDKKDEAEEADEAEKEADKAEEEAEDAKDKAEEAKDKAEDAKDEAEEAKEKAEEEKKDLDVKRISGDSRYLTAIEVSKALYEDDEKAEAVVLVSGENTADALAAGPLAIAKKAPILLASKDDALKEEIERLGAKTIYIIGGENSVAKEFETAFGEKEVVRLAGANRIETSIEVAKCLKAKNIILANAFNSVDALASSGLAKKEDGAIILTGKDMLDDSIKAYIEENKEGKIFVVGGENSVAPEAIEGLEVERIAGENRYETALKLAQRSAEDLEKAVIVSGDNAKLVDALAAAPLAAKENAPILLTDGAKLTESVKEFALKVGIKDFLLIGGENTLSDDVFTALQGLALTEIEDEERIAEEKAKEAEEEAEKAEEKAEEAEEKAEEAKEEAKDAEEKAEETEEVEETEAKPAE